MIFYVVKIKKTPKPIFACTVETDNYRNRFPHTEDLLEITVCEKGGIIYDYPDGTHEEISAGSVAVITKDTVCTTSAPEGRHRHTTVGIVAEYDYEKVIFSDATDIKALQERVRNGGEILIPYGEMLNAGEIDTIIEMMRQIGAAMVSSNPSGVVKALAGWYSLAWMLTDAVLRKLDNSERKIILGTSATEYAKKAKAYIRENIHEKISVAEIADYVGISEGYLHGIFKPATEMSIVEYINLYRVNLVKQHIISRKISLKEAAYLVGIDDPAYMSRLFRKVTGESYREYCEKLGGVN